VTYRLLGDNIVILLFSGASDDLLFLVSAEELSDALEHGVD
jgi:hypothetical protein